MSDGHSVIESTPAEIRRLSEAPPLAASFFRDPEDWKALCLQIERRVRKVAAGGELRAWVPACSTGEDAYALAIVAREAIARSRRRVAFRVFATDVDPAAIDHARHAHYGSSIRDDVSPERLKRFFSPTDGTYRVRPDVRQMVRFGRQDVLLDAPITHVDVIVCRNFLGQLDGETRAKVLSLFHSALRPDGVLFLGTADTAEGAAAFSPARRRHRIYRRSREPKTRTLRVWPISNEADVRPRPAPARAARFLSQRDDGGALEFTLEELVTTNEQLETARQEVATLNDDLVCSNATLRREIESLTQARDDLNNLTRTEGIAAVFVSNDLRIERFTDMARRFLPLRPEDIGRPLSDLSHRLHHDRFIEDAREARDTLRVKKIATTMAGAAVFVRMSPYVTAEKQVSGLVIGFVDVDALLRSFE